MCYCEGIFERKKQHFRSNQNHWGREGGVAWRNQGSDSTGALQHMEQKPGFSAVCLCSRRVILPLFTQSQSASAFLFPSAVCTFNAEPPRLLLWVAVDDSTRWTFQGVTINDNSPVRTGERGSFEKHHVILSFRASRLLLNQSDEVRKLMCLTVVSFWHIWIHFFATVKFATPCMI